MSKGSHEVTKSVKTRLCEWRGLNCYEGAANCRAEIMLCMILRRNMFMRRAPEDEQRESRSDEERENAALRMARAELDCFPHCKYVENPVY